MLGILEGKGDNMFGPKDSLTRAQAITVVNKLIGRLPGEGTTSFGAVADQMKTWPDNMDTTAWYYAAIQEATNSHDYERNAKWAAADEQWTALRETRDWKALEQ